MIFIQLNANYSKRKPAMNIFLSLFFKTILTDLNKTYK